MSKASLEIAEPEVQPVGTPGLTIIDLGTPPRGMENLVNDPEDVDEPPKNCTWTGVYTPQADIGRRQNPLIVFPDEEVARKYLVNSPVIFDGTPTLVWVNAEEAQDLSNRLYNGQVILMPA